MYYTDDPLRDFARYDAEQQAELDKLPECACCGYEIQQEDAFCLDGKWICDDCLPEFRKEIAKW